MLRPFSSKWLIVALAVGLCYAALSEAPVRARPEWPRARSKSGLEVLKAFSSISASTRHSVVKLELDDKPVALAAVVRRNGVVVTKASELGQGKLTAKLASGQRVSAQVLAADEENDLALVKLATDGLKPVEWLNDEVSVGQWVITQGVDREPDAVGIVSVAPRRILPKQAYIGVRPDFSAATAKIAEVLPGLGAEKAGLKSGDVIVAVNDQPIGNGEELVQTLRQFREGQTVKLKVRRNDNELEAIAKMMIPPPERGRRGFDRQRRFNRVNGELSRRAEGFQMAIQHDTVMQPWECGGPLLNLDGKAVGLNIARAGRVASYALPAALVQELVARLEANKELPVKSDSSDAPRPDS